MAFPQWFAGQPITADGLNGRSMRLITQENDQQPTTTGVLDKSEIFFTPEPNAVYAYWLYIAYSAATDGDFLWEWGEQAATGVLMASFTQAYAASAASGVNTGALIIMRRPGNSTNRVAGGTDIANFHSAYDAGTFATDSNPGEQAVWFTQNASSTKSILRGGNQTRLLYQRIA